MGDQVQECGDAEEGVWVEQELAVGGFGSAPVSSRKLYHVLLPRDVFQPQMVHFLTNMFFCRKELFKVYTSSYTIPRR